MGVLLAAPQASAQGARRCRPLRADGGVTCPEPWGVCRVGVPGGASLLLRDDDLTQEPATRVWLDTNHDGTAEATLDVAFTERGQPLSLRLDHNGNGLVDEEVRNEFDRTGNWLSAQRWARWQQDSDVQPAFRHRYDDAGRLVERRESSSGKVVETFSYDDAGWLSGQSSWGEQRLIVRSDAGHVVLDRWRRGEKVQREERSQFDPRGRLIERVRENLETGFSETTRGWAVDGGGWLEEGSEKKVSRTVVDVNGRLVERWQFEGGPEPVGYLHAYDRNGRLSRIRRVQRYGDPQVMAFTHDDAGQVVGVRSLWNNKLQWQERFHFEAGRVVRIESPFRPLRLRVRDGGVVEADEGWQTLHFEYDAALLKRWNETAPLACTKDDVVDREAPFPRPPSPPLMTAQTQRFVDAPLPDAGSLDASRGQQLSWAMSALRTATLDRALETDGLEVVMPVQEHVLAGRHGVLVEKATYFCGDAPRYVFDRKAKSVARLQENVTCGSQVTVSMEGALGADGCGTQPPREDWFVAVPRGTQLVREARGVPVVLPVCITVDPKGGFSHPP
ncbi:MAG: hypothetical protein Q8L14_39550 [Myxococcales bacterium]|nr:hypothetical protein [Myxococcales bacterium]